MLSIPLMPDPIIRYGVSVIPPSIPIYIASVPSPAAVARSSIGNQRAASLVIALRMKGCPIAMPICARSNIL